VTSNTTKMNSPNCAKKLTKSVKRRRLTRAAANATRKSAVAKSKDTAITNIDYIVN